MQLASEPLGRLVRPARQVLSVLASGPRIPEAIRQDVSNHCGVELRPGTLFGAIAHLERCALIEVVASATAPRAYRLTAIGAAAWEAKSASVTPPASLLTRRPTRSPAQ